MTEETCIRPYEALANAIVLRAVQEFRVMYKRKKRNPFDSKAIDVVKEISEWFYSDDFCMLTELDGPVLLAKLIKEADADMAKRKVR